MTTGASSFLVEDFLNSITVQLDRVQDSLRLKAINRPLTYALKDFALDLQVFVELDAHGSVRFRNASANEAGASTVRLGFTTITKPMIDENTISLAATRSPSLDQLGIDATEQRRLEQLGVRNAAQLQNLASSTGTQTMSRLADMPIERLRQALQFGRPQIRQIGPAKTPPPVPSLPVPPVIRVAAGTPHLEVRGSQLIGPGSSVPAVRLNREMLSLAHAEDDRLVIALPAAPISGALEIEMPDGEVLAYRLEVEDTVVPRRADGRADRHADEWEPGASRS